MAGLRGFYRSCPCPRQPSPMGRIWEVPRVEIRRNKKLHTVIKLPMSIRCNTCGDYISEGTKFACGTEEFVGETYSGFNGFRFFFKCLKCSVKITIKSYSHDPKCVVESGATTVGDNEKRRSEAEELGDVMNPLQRRTYSLPDLDETKSSKKSKDFVRRIEDGHSEAEEYTTQPCASNDVLSNNALKRRKFSEEVLDKPTDSVTKHTTSDILDDKGNSVGLLDRSGE